jgi:hypothetical protein
MSAGGIVPILAAAAAARRRRQEEERMPTYSGEDLSGWEFKIVTSNFGRFSSYQAIQKICQEEAETGWELVEKFDNHRLRFKRRVERRSNDHLAQRDPYRTSPSSNWSAKTTALILGIVLLLVGAALLFLLDKNTGGALPLPIVYIVIAVLVALLLVMVLHRRHR